MPCDSSLVGTTLGPFEFEIDQFRTMAYAAGLGDANPRYIDSLKSGRLVAHPFFPATFAVAAPMAEMDRLMDAAGLTREESIRRVHATHDMRVYRLARPPEKLFVRTTLLGVERRPPGAYVVTRYETLDAAGAPVATIDWGRIFRGVAVKGDDRPAASEPPPVWRGAADAFRAECKLPIAATAAIVYTACARPGNPVNFHTDTAAARRSGLPAPILMGVATLAMSVSRVIDAEAGGDPERVARIRGRFGAMVFMPSEATVKIAARAKIADGEDAVFFETLTAEGGRAVRDGVVTLRA